MPILFLSARDEEIDRILGLEIGGDDYVTKPFSPRELVARVNVILRRAAARAGPNGQHAPLAQGQLSVDPEQHVAAFAGTPLRLTAIEFGILRAFLTRPSAVFSREQIMAAAYQLNIQVSDRTIDSHIRNIRAKLAAVNCDNVDRDHSRRRLQARPLRAAGMSDAPAREKWRPSLGLVIFAVLASVATLPLVGLFFFRLYDNQLIRQTQAELIAQSRVLAAVYAREVEARLDSGLVLGAELPPEARTDPEDRVTPIRPALDLAANDLLMRRPDARPAGTPAEPALCRDRREADADRAGDAEGHARRLSHSRSPWRRHRRPAGDRASRSPISRRSRRR